MFISLPLLGYYVLQQQRPDGRVKAACHRLHDENLEKSNHAIRAQNASTAHDCVIICLLISLSLTFDPRLDFLDDHRGTVVEETKLSRCHFY